MPALCRSPWPALAYAWVSCLLHRTSWRTGLGRIPDCHETFFDQAIEQEFNLAGAKEVGKGGYLGRGGPVIFSLENTQYTYCQHARRNELRGSFPEGKNQE